MELMQTKGKIQSLRDSERSSALFSGICLCSSRETHHLQAKENLSWTNTHIKFLQMQWQELVIMQ